MRIYFDVCCLNRTFDDQAQERVRLETEAIRLLLERAADDELVWVMSEAVEFEIDEDRDDERRRQVTDLIRVASERLEMSPSIAKRAQFLEGAGLRGMDAFHLSFAEFGKCDILFTVDDGFERRARRLKPPSQVRVVNPMRWLLESSDGDQTA